MLGKLFHSYWRKFNFHNNLYHDWSRFWIYYKCLFHYMNTIKSIAICKISILYRKLSKFIQQLKVFTQLYLQQMFCVNLKRHCHQTECYDKLDISLVVNSPILSYFEYKYTLNCDHRTEWIFLNAGEKDK